MKFLALATVMVALLAACGESGPKVGTIVKKIHEPEHRWTMNVPIKVSEICSTTKIGTTTTRNCTPIYTNIPFTFTDDEDWVFEVEDDNGKRGRVKVSKEDWDSEKVGDWWDGERVPDPNQRHKKGGG